MKTSALSFGPVLVALVSFHCGGAVGTEPGGGGKGPVPAADGGAPDSGPAPGSVVGDCGPGESCPSGSTCYYPIGDCNAQPECVEDPAPGTPECGALELLCGCGTMVTSGCGFPEGFASGPSNGESASCDIPTPAPPIDASVPPSEDAGGPCTQDTDCQDGYGCYYLIGECPGSGQCVAQPTGPECGAVESLCGCDGVSQVTAGCGFPNGYASGPTGGSSVCGISEPEDASVFNGGDAGVGAGEDASK